MIKATLTMKDGTLKFIDALNWPDFILALQKEDAYRAIDARAVRPQDFRQGK